MVIDELKAKAELSQRDECTVCTRRDIFLGLPNTSSQILAIMMNRFFGTDFEFEAMI